MVMITLTIVMLVPAVGTILPIALIAAPAAALAPWTRTMRHLLIAAPVLGAATALAGLLIAVRLSLSAGGVIAVTSGVVYLLSALVHGRDERSSGAAATQGMSPQRPNENDRRSPGLHKNRND